VDVLALHGNLSPDDQDRAILPSPSGRRKIVLATSIAETSLTIEGVRVVIDSGLARVPRFSPRTGMTRLETVRVTRAAADQRRGRAARLGPGICYRLWTEHEQAQLLPHIKPEILDADLAPLALELTIAGIGDPLELKWLDPPPAAALAQARELLRELDAVDGAGRATEHGRAIAPLAVHPRLAHMLLRAKQLRSTSTACAIAALLGERDLFRADATLADADLRARLEVISGSVVREQVDHATMHRIRTEMDRLMRALHMTGARDRIEPALAGLLIAFAYPDRIARRRGGHGRYLLRNGRGAMVDRRDPLGIEELLAIAAIDGREPESRIFLAAPLSRDELETHFGEQIVTEREMVWDERSDAVVARRRERLGAIVLAEHALADADPGEIAGALVRALAAAGVSALPWSEAARRLRERLAFLHEVDPNWPDVSDATLAASIDQWLTPRVMGMRRREEVGRLDLSAALLELLDWRQRSLLDELAPTHLVVPSGSRIPIDYADPAAPVLAVRLQEMFGLADTPRIAGGRVPLTLHLLSPAQRPVQVTRDLAGFWRSSYFDVQRELRGRYPKHEWPDDPLAATPTSRAKRRSR
jgi:ATP-dependent helicase HrpB